MWVDAGSRSLSECAKACYDREGCIYFGYGKDAQARSCKFSSDSCVNRQKSVLHYFDVYSLVSVSSGAFKWFRTWASCAEVAETLSGMKGRYVQTPEACVSACQLELGSTYFSWNEFAQPKFSSDGKNQMCKCFRQDVSCTLSEDCCKPHPKLGNNCQEQKGTNDQKKLWEECKPTGGFEKIGIVLETTESKALALPCPSMNTYITSNMPTIGRDRMDLVEHCFAKCTSTLACKFGAYEVKTKTCFMLSGSITGVYRKLGWIVGSRNCATKMQIVPETMFWDASVYL